MKEFNKLELREAEYKNKWYDIVEWLNNGDSIIFTNNRIITLTAGQYNWRFKR